MSEADHSAEGSGAKSYRGGVGLNDVLGGWREGEPGQGNCGAGTEGRHSGKHLGPQGASSAGPKGGPPGPMLGHNACWRRQGFPKVASHEAKAMNVWSQVVRSALTEA